MKTQEYVELVLSGIDDRYIGESVKYVSDGKCYRKIWKRLGTAAACLCAAFILLISSLSIATAAGSSSAYEALYTLFPGAAEFFSPVNESCVDNGIEMCVKAIYVHDDSADIYISMKDLTGDRIDETTDLFDSYEIRPSYDQIGGCQRVGYDAGNKETTFLISVRQPGNRIAGKKLTFRVSEFLSGKQEVTMELPMIELEHAQKAAEILLPEDMDARIRGCSFAASGDVDEEDITEYLAPDAGVKFSPVDGVEVTAYGFVDGKLHIQTHYENIQEYDNHGEIYLVNPDGERILCAVKVSFWDEEGTGSYDEFIFDAGEADDLSGYSAEGYFVTCDERCEGSWSVTFPIENSY